MQSGLNNISLRLLTQYNSTSSSSITPGSLANKFSYKVPDTSYNNGMTSNKSTNKYSRAENKKTSTGAGTGIRAMVPGRR